MTDLHTHILPGMDDGSKHVAMSLAMLRSEWQQGVTAVVLTPHFYRDMERTDDFLRRRSEAYDALRRAVDGCAPEDRRALPALSLGAEVAWVAGMGAWRRVQELCYEGTHYLLLEPPFQAWNEQFFHDVYDLMNRGFTPVIAHIDRYLGTQKPEALERLFSLGLPTQISAEPFLHWGSRGRMLRCLRSGRAQLLISDCHNMETRPPNLGAAMELIRKKLGAQAESLFDETDELLRPEVWLDA
ncbi:MAG: hypothetical protein K6G54_01420 [Oscillospiraceae bacterium]|nr:hypothetical protein [Oscillospiraceae bacterium]